MSKTPKDTNTATRIYHLSDPITNQVRYVGKTVESLDERLYKHIWDTRTNPYKVNWIKSLIKINKLPIITLIEECPWNESQDKEINWILYYKGKGEKLVNLTDGGEGNLGNKKSDLARRKMSDSIRKKIGFRVYQYNLDGSFIKEWRDITEAANTLKLKSGNISQVCRLEKKSHGNFIWSRFPPEEIKIDNYRRLKSKPKTFENNTFVKKSKSITVINMNTKESFTFKSLKEASEFTKISKPSICYECKGKRKSRGIYEFRYT